MQHDGREYHDRVNRVLDYIPEHLDGDLSLRRLSRLACFSPFHFHRIFQGITGETLNGHVRRVRLERAVALMKASPARLLTGIALATGFAGGSEFSRAFKQHFGRNASSWDRRSPLENSKIRQADSGMPFHTEEELMRWKAESGGTVRTRHWEAFRFAYFRIYAPFAGTGLIDSHTALTAWLKERATDWRDVVLVGMSLDDPSVTPAEKCGYDLGVAFPTVKASNGILGEIIGSRGGHWGRALVPELGECRARGLSVREFAQQPVLSMRCTGSIGEVLYVWQYLYRLALPQSSFDPGDLPAMEMFVKLPEEIGWETFDLEACIPVVKR